MNISEEEQRNFILTLTLKSIALVKITTTLWTQDDIVDLVAELSFPLIQSERLQKWQPIKDKVIEKVPHLPLPEPFKKQVFGSINAIGEQLLKWILFHKPLLGEGYVKTNFVKVCWSPQGTVDRKKTAEAIIKDENVDVVIRYKLACINCLEDNILELWGPLPERKKADFYDVGHTNFWRKHDLVVFWTYKIKGELYKLNDLIRGYKNKEMSPYQFAFEDAAFEGNIAATVYFLQKLTTNEREESLVEYAAVAAKRRVYSVDDEITEFADVVCFLLSQLNAGQHIKVFQKYPYEVLQCFLDRPWLELFMDTANRMWPFLSILKFPDFLEKIVDKVNHGYNDCDYQLLFKEIWEQSSKHHKKYVLHKCSTGGLLLSKLFMVKDNKNVSLILKGATLKQKEKIIFCSDNMDLCECLAYDNEWDLLQIFITECVSSKEKVIKLRDEFRKRMEAESGSRILKKEDWNKFFNLLNDLFEKDDKKRGVELCGDNSAKRLCHSIGV